MTEFIIPTDMSIADYVQNSHVLRGILQDWINWGLFDPETDTIEDFYFNYIQSDEFKGEIENNYTLPDSLSDLGVDFNDNGQVVMPDGKIVELWSDDNVSSGLTDKFYELETELNNRNIPTQKLKTLEEYRYDDFLDDYAINHPYMSYSQRQEYLAHHYPEFKHLLTQQTVVNPTYLQKTYQGKRNESGRRTKIAMIEEELRSRTPALMSTLDAKLKSKTILPARYIHDQAIKIFDSGYNSVAEYENIHGIGSATLFQYQDNDPISLTPTLTLNNQQGNYQFIQGGNNMQPNPINHVAKPAAPAAPVTGMPTGNSGTFKNNNVQSTTEMMNKIKSAQKQLDVNTPKTLPTIPESLMSNPTENVVVPKIQETTTQQNIPQPNTSQTQPTPTSQPPVIPVETKQDPTPKPISDAEIEAVQQNTMKTMSVHERARKLEEELTEEIRHEEEQRRRGIIPENLYNVQPTHIYNRGGDSLQERYRNNQIIEDGLAKLNSLDNPRLAAARIAFTDFEEILAYAVISGIFPETKFDSLMKFLNLIGVGDQFADSVELLTKEQIPPEYQYTTMRMVNLKNNIKNPDNISEHDAEFSRRSKIVNDKKPIFGSITRTHIIDLLDYINRNGIFVHFNNQKEQYSYAELAKYAQDYEYSDRVAHSWRSLITYICEDLGMDDQLLIEAYSLTYGKEPKKKERQQEDLIMMNNKEIINKTMSAVMPANMTGRVTIPTQNNTPPQMVTTPQVQNVTPQVQTQNTVSVQNTQPQVQNIQPQVQNVQPQVQNVTPQVQTQNTVPVQNTQPQVQQFVQPQVQQFVQPQTQINNQANVNQGGNMYTQPVMNQYQQAGVVAQPGMQTQTMGYIQPQTQQFTQPVMNQYQTPQVQQFVQPQVQQFVQPQVQQFVQPVMNQPQTYMQNQNMMNNPYAPKPQVQQFVQPMMNNPYAPRPQVQQFVQPMMNQNMMNNPYMPNQNMMMNNNPYMPNQMMNQNMMSTNPYMQNQMVNQNPYMMNNPMMNNPMMNNNPYAPKPQVQQFVQPMMNNPYMPNQNMMMNNNPYMQNPMMNQNMMMNNNPYMMNNPYMPNQNMMNSNPMMTQNPYMMSNPMMAQNTMMGQNPYMMNNNPYMPNQMMNQNMMMNNNPYMMNNPMMNTYGMYGRNFY